MDHTEWNIKFDALSPGLQEEYDNIWKFIQTQLMGRDFKAKITFEMSPIKIGDREFCHSFSKEIDCTVHWAYGMIGDAFVGSGYRDGRMIEIFQDKLQKAFQKEIDLCIQRIETREAQTGLEWG